MIKFNKALEYIYYILTLVWVGWGGNYFFFQLEQYHRNFITAVYGLLFAAIIFYIGYLHKKAETVTVFPIVSLINIGLAGWIIFIFFTASENGGLLTYMLLCVNAIITFITLSIGTFVARKTWPKATILTVLLVVFAIIWTFIFT